MIGPKQRRFVDPGELAAAFAEAATAVRRGDPATLAGRVSPVGPVIALGQRFELSSKEFAAPNHIPLATLDAWERGTTKPDAVARAFLQLVEAGPETVARMFAGTAPVAAK